MIKMKNKPLVLVLLVSLLTVMTLFMTSCGDNAPATLEDYFNSNEELLQEIEANSTDGMEIDVTDDTLSYIYKYNQSFDDATTKLMSAELKKAVSSMDSTFASLRDSLIEDTGFENVAIKIIYMDADDDILYEKSY